MNDKVIYCSITGFEQDGPLADSGHDLVIQAVTEIMGVNLERGSGCPVPLFQTLTIPQVSSP